jgi:hypothetical protein
MQAFHYPFPGCEYLFACKPINTVIFTMYVAWITY